MCKFEITVLYSARKTDLPHAALLKCVLTSAKSLLGAARVHPLAGKHSDTISAMLYSVF
jgi:hypothetical protein